jgi:hypothetical protein
MSAVTLSELNQAGIVATVADGKLRLSAPAGRLTSALRERIASNRDALLRELAGQRVHLLALAAEEGLPTGLVHGLSAADAAACGGLSDDTLRAYLHALDHGATMDAGRLLPGYTQAGHCDGCGPVLLWPGCPNVLNACPWCRRRMAGMPVPRPWSTPCAPANESAGDIARARMS